MRVVGVVWVGGASEGVEIGIGAGATERGGSRGMISVPMENVEVALSVAHGTRPVLCELLEARRMLSVSAELGADAVLTVLGTDGADVIHIRPGPAGITVESGGQRVGTFAGATSVRVAGGGGDDQLIVAAGVGLPVALEGGAGDDTLVASSPRATLSGGEGTDALWAGRKTRLSTPDLSPLEARRGVNRLPEVFSRANVAAAPAGARAVGSLVGKITGTVSEAWRPVEKGTNKAVKSVRETLREPKLTKVAAGTADFTGNPLFSESGPTAADVSQGSLNNCYFLVTLAGTAAADPSVIRQTVTDLGDGTYAVRLIRGKTATYYRVDADLPVVSGTSRLPAYADLGRGNALWVALVEKAYALDRGGSYGRLDKGGWMSDVFASLGMRSKTVAPGTALAGGPSGLMAMIAVQLAAGKIVTLGTKSALPDDVPMVKNHAYVVESVIRDESGRATGLRLRNPWSWDGPAGDGIVNLDAKTVGRGVSALAIGTV